MTEPDPNDPTAPPGDSWWKPLAPDTPPEPVEEREGWWTAPTEDEPDRPVPEPDAPVTAPAPAAEPISDPEPALAPDPDPEPVAVAPSPAEPTTVIPAAAPAAAVPRVDPVEPDPDDPPDEPAPRRRGQSTKALVEWVAVIVGALLVALVVKTFLFQAFYIPSESMEPTLEKGDRVLVNKLSYDLHDVHRGDVIVFELDDQDVGADGIKDLIKRVIGLPGDTIETREGAVYINDRLLEEPYLAEGTITGDPTNGSNPEIPRQVVPEGTVFVLGDNRDNSADSRYPDRGPIPIEDIVGRAFVLVWPPGEISTL